jgi:glycosyltransferase involved in cell wall biosynthesis
VLISAVIIAGNEEAKIADAIRSVDWADEVVVVDSESVDRTREIGESLGARVIVRAWTGFSDQKQFAVDQAGHDWIFSIDADERVSDKLRSEILSIKQNGAAAEGYRIPRLAIYMGREIRHSGWYPDWQLRLFDRRRGRWNGNVIHESVRMDEGTHVEKLRGHLIHLTVDSTEEHEQMIRERYAPLAARQMHERGRRTNWLRMNTAGPITFLSSYVLKLGFLDGRPGFVIARFAARHASLKHSLLNELQKGK